MRAAHFCRTVRRNERPAPLRVRPRHEKSVAQALERQGYEQLLPLYELRHHWMHANSRTVRVQRLPLFPTYVFCRFDAERSLPIVRTPGVLHIVSFARNPVARRAKPRDVHTDHRTFVEAAHTGYLRLRDPVLHRRRLELYPDALVVSDRLEGRRAHSVEIFFHCHPDAQVRLELDARLTRAVLDTHWHPGFNRSVPNQTIVGRWSGQLPASFAGRIFLRG